jgi:hypothetical protein
MASNNNKMHCTAFTRQMMQQIRVPTGDWVNPAENHIHFEFAISQELTMSQFFASKPKQHHP